MSVRCDVCGTRKNVKRAFMTMWNGNVYDLCFKCAEPFFKLANKLRTWKSG